MIQLSDQLRVLNELCKLSILPQCCNHFILQTQQLFATLTTSGDLILMGKVCLFSSGLHFSTLACTLPGFLACLCMLLKSGMSPTSPSVPRLFVSVVAADLLTFCAMLQYMTYHGVECEILPLPTCEPNKSFNLIFQVAERLEAFKLNRSALNIGCSLYYQDVTSG